MSIRTYSYRQWESAGDPQSTEMFWGGFLVEDEFTE